MANEQLNEYIHKARQAGLNDDKIKAELLKTGWQANHVSEALSPTIQEIPTTRKSHRGLVIAVIVAAVLFVGTGVVVAIRYFVQPTLPELTQEYHNDKYSYTIRYPSSHKVIDSSDPSFSKLLAAAAPNPDKGTILITHNNSETNPSHIKLFIAYFPSSLPYTEFVDGMKTSFDKMTPDYQFTEPRLGNQQMPGARFKMGESGSSATGASELFFLQNRASYYAVTVEYPFDKNQKRHSNLSYSVVDSISFDENYEGDLLFDTDFSSTEEEVVNEEEGNILEDTDSDTKDEQAEPKQDSPEVDDVNSAYRTYQNSTYGYSFEYPKDYKVKEEDIGGNLFINHPSDFIQILAIRRPSPDKYESLTAYAEHIRNQNEEYKKEGKITNYSETNITIGKQSIPAIQFYVNSTGGPPLGIWETIIFEYDGHLYWTHKALSDDVIGQKRRDNYNEVLNSLSFD